MAGRRARYLHPIKMYVFTSAIFFLLFFSFFSPRGNFTGNTQKPLTAIEREEYIKKLQGRLLKDSGNVLLQEKLALAKDTSRPITEIDLWALLDEEDKAVIQFGRKNYKTVSEYDSMEQLLPSSERDGWFMRRLTKKQIDLNNKYRQNPQEAWRKLGDSILHRMPYMLFVSLPLFALILRLVYIRRKQFYFADHGVFTIHIYVFSFLMLLVLFSLTALDEATHWGFIQPLIVILSIVLYFYLYIAMRNFYRQGWGKTFLKFLLVSILSLFMMLVLFLFFIFFSAFTL